MQQRLAGDIKPIVVNVCNFAKPQDGQPALLSYDDARTLFHEFGHALHQILSDVTYPSVSGTSVARDFVERLTGRQRAAVHSPPEASELSRSCEASMLSAR